MNIQRRLRRCTTWVHYKVECFQQSLRHQRTPQRLNNHIYDNPILYSQNGLERFWKHSFTCSSQMQHKITSHKWLLWKYDHKEDILVVTLFLFLQHHARQPILLKLSKISFHITIKWFWLGMHKTKWTQYESWDFVSYQK